VTYINCGDWVDSCTAIVEHRDGRLELVHWNDSMGEAEALLDDSVSATEAEELAA
jgi:hypothetical protein